jgi:hypothetical protein
MNCESLSSKKVNRVIRYAALIIGATVLLPGCALLRRTSVETDTRTETARTEDRRRATAWTEDITIVIPPRRETPAIRPDFTGPALEIPESIPEYPAGTVITIRRRATENQVDAVTYDSVATSATDEKTETDAQAATGIGWWLVSFLAGLALALYLFIRARFRVI